MAVRATSSTTISLGLVSIPVKLYTAASDKRVSFNQLHAKCGSRIKQQYVCPVDGETVERDQIVKGLEIAKDQYVQFTEEELRALDAQRFDTLDLLEFVPAATVDSVYVEKSYYLGPDKGGDKAFGLLAQAMRRLDRVAVGRQWSRGKVCLVLVRPYKKGLILHHVYYANEVRSYEDLELGPDQLFSEPEQQLAGRLIEQMSQPAFEPQKYHDEYAQRVNQAAEEKAKGGTITAQPSQPAAQVIDLFEALRRSVDSGSPTAAAPAATVEPATPAEPVTAEPVAAAKAAKKREPRRPKLVGLH